MGVYLDKSGTQYLWGKSKTKADALISLGKPYGSNLMSDVSGPAVFGISAYARLTKSGSTLYPTTSGYGVIWSNPDTAQGTEITIPLPSRGWAARVGEIADHLIIDSSGNVTWTLNIDAIFSYNGETINTPWVSSTGELSTGATVYYVKSKPVVETKTAITLPEFITTTRVDLSQFTDVSIIWWTYEAYALYQDLLSQIPEVSTMNLLEARSLISSVNKYILISFNPGVSEDESFSGTMLSQTVKYDDTTWTYPECSYTRSGYTFDKWCYRADGLGPTVSAGDVLQDTADVTLYALWTAASSE